MKDGEDTRTGGWGGVKSEGGKKQKEGEGRKEGKKDFLKTVQRAPGIFLMGGFKRKIQFLSKNSSLDFFPTNPPK